MKNDIFKNSEGYTDHTAGKAISLYELKTPPQKKGEIWTVSNPDFNKDPGEWYVIAPQTNGWVTCLEVKSTLTRPIRDAADCVYLSIMDDEKRYVDTRNVWTKPGRYFLDKIQDIDPIVIDSIDSTVKKALLIDVDYDMAENELLEKYHKLERENFKLRETIKNAEWSRQTGLTKPIWDINDIPEEIHADVVRIELKLINGGTEQKIVIH